MRILQIRFKNLNSLVGEWELDLTHPVFTSDGIFAITGPTGSGKTTILDAVCLALYGRTPRLSKVTRSGNEIMSRQTGECFAEVTFETQAGRFRCHWCQHRARKKTDGELQAPRHEIADADSGRIFETKLRGVAEQIETATGMDFDRFTRSMLLAQGGFAAFLQANPDERAPILEQITGTEIYSRISMRVHERRSEERKKLDTLQAELAGVQLLSEEDERQLNAVLEQKTLQDTELNRQVADTGKSVAWLDGLAALEQELKLVEELKKDWQTRQDAFAPSHEKLQRATRALELAGEHAGLVSIRGEQESEFRGRGACLAALPACDEGVKQAEQAMLSAGEHLAKKKAEQNESMPDIRKARELDLKLGEKAAPVKAAGESVVEREKALESLRSGQDEDLAALGEKTETLRELLEHLSRIRADEGLVGQLAGISGRFDALKSLREQQHTKLEEVRAAGNRLEELTRNMNERASSLEMLKSGLEDVGARFNDRQLALSKTLEVRDLPEWRVRLSSLSERRLLLEKADATVCSLAESRRSLVELGRRQAELAGEKSRLETLLQVQVQRHDALERETSLLETQLSLLDRIRDFEEARSQLRDGEPCPLCGSSEHPFAAGNIPAPDEATSALAKAKTDLKAASGAVAELKVKQAEVSKELELVTSWKKDCSEGIKSSEDLVSRSLAELDADLSGRDAKTVLLSLRNENDDNLNHAAKIVRTVEAGEKEVAALRDLQEKFRENVAQTEREAQDAARQKDFAGLTFERLGEEAAALEDRHGKALDELLLEVSAYGIDSLATEALDRVMLELTARREQWIDRQKDRSLLEQHIAALEIRTRQRVEQIRESATELEKQRGLLDGLQRERDALLRERHELFGERSPDNEEARLAEAVEVADKDLAISRDAFNAAGQECRRLKDRIGELDKSIAARAVRLQSATEAFHARLEVAGFPDEAAYLAACLPEVERSALMEQARKLNDEQTELAAKERDRTALLEVERRKGVTDRPRLELGQMLDVLVSCQRELQQEIGAIRQKLKDNDSRRSMQQERIGAIDAQKRECGRWDLLHELIGSADGKKYRNFAQGLTFDMMIGHANRELQELSDRYLLTRDDAQPLELSVVDNYQAGEIRSTRNLSGGESFIVSLALALGLSHMASRNVRVDSLFLDEGFGTLDEETLETALETLAGLRQDGKLIGVISHVSELKERIGAQIQVVPLPGGRSMVSGPGVRKI